jgi:hypothetical protein
MRHGRFYFLLLCEECKYCSCCLVAGCSFVGGMHVTSACLVTFYSSCSAKVSQSQIMKPPGQRVSLLPRLCPPLSASHCLTMSVSDRIVCIPFILIKSMFSHFYCLLFPVHLFPHHAYTHPRILPNEVNASICCCYRPSSCTCPVSSLRMGT